VYNSLTSLIINQMKKSLPLFIVPIVLFALVQSVKAQDQSPKYFFQGVERLNSKAGFRYVYDVQNKIKASVYYDSQGKIPHVDSIYYDGQGRINRVDQYQVLSGEIPDPLPLDTRFQYTYDEKGRVHERIMYYGYALDNPAGKKELIYDEHGNNIIIRTYLLSIGKTVDMRYVYNEKNQLIKSGYPSDEDPNKITTNIKTYEYDENGNLIKENSYTDEPNPMLNGYVQYTYKDKNLTDMLLMDINPETTAEKVYLIFKFEYNNQAMGKDAYYPAYPFSYDGPMFHNSIVEDALSNGNLRTTMISIDPDVEESKQKTTFAYLYKNNDPASVERVGAAKEFKAYKNGGVLTIEGYRISKTSVYDMNGKVVANVDAQADRIDIPAEALGRGVFVVVAQNAKGQKVNVKVIL
jgi:putative immunoreactiveantigen PG99